MIDSKPKGECSTHCWPSILCSSSSTSESRHSTAEAKASSALPEVDHAVGERCLSSLRPGADEVLMNGIADYESNVIEHWSSISPQGNPKNLHSRGNTASALSAKRQKRCRAGVHGTCPAVFTLDMYCEVCHG